MQLSNRKSVLGLFHFYLKKQKNYVSGSVPIYMRITIQGNRAEMATNRDCDPKRWNAKGCRAIGSKEEVKVLNTHLDQFTNSHPLLDAVADHNLKMEQLVGAFDHYPRSDKNCANNYVVKNIKNLGKVLRICVENEWIDKSPFNLYKGKTKGVDRFYLNKEELAHIAGTEFLSERLKQVRDVFIFCCFTGLAYIDVFKLKQENIRKGIDGDQWIFTNRQKTKTRSSVPLL